MWIKDEPDVNHFRPKRVQNKYNDRYSLFNVRKCKIPWHAEGKVIISYCKWIEILCLFSIIRNSSHPLSPIHHPRICKSIQWCVVRNFGTNLYLSIVKELSLFISSFNIIGYSMCVVRVFLRVRVNLWFCIWAEIDIELVSIIFVFSSKLLCYVQTTWYPCVSKCVAV